MSLSCPLADSLFAEHRALCREYAAVQARCSRLIAQQRAQIECLQAQVVRLRAAAIVQVSVRAFVRQRPAPDTQALLEASRVAADWVICQTGCLSHGAYWRVEDHCRRTGKTCVLVEQSAAAHIAGFEPPSQSESAIEWLAAPAS